MGRIEDKMSQGTNLDLRITEELSLPEYVLKELIVATRDNVLLSGKLEAMTHRNKVQDETIERLEREADCLRNSLNEAHETQRMLRDENVRLMKQVDEFIEQREEK